MSNPPDACVDQDQQPRGDDASRIDPKGTPRLAEALLYCAKVWLALRVGLGLLGLLAVGLLEPNAPAPVPGWAPPPNVPGWDNLVTAWERWDALWFLRIATQGYSPTDSSAAFFPLYPLLIRGLSILLGGHPLAAALLISNLAFLAALVVVYLLTSEEAGRDAARRTVVYLGVFPTAYFFFAPYTESLFLLLVAACLWGARRRRWELAGVAGALASATRSVGLVLVPTLVVEAFLQWRAEKDAPGRTWRALGALAWSAFAALGALAYLAYWGATTGDWLAPVSQQGGWLREFSWPWESVADGTRVALAFVGHYPGAYHMLDWILVLVTLAAAVALAFRVRATYSVYVWASLLLPLSLVFGGRPLMSLPRFVLPLFPLFWVLAGFAQRYRAHNLLVAGFAAGLGVMTVLFVNWYYVF